MSLGAIARLAKMSKANIYRYFETREAIYVEILCVEQEAWVGALETALSPLAGSDDVDGWLEELLERTTGRDQMIALLAALPSVLEHNVSAATIRRSRRRILRSQNRLIDASLTALPSLTTEAARHFFTFFITFMAGLYPHTHLPRHVAEVMAEPEFAAGDRDFRRTLHDQARVVLAGLLAVRR